MKRKMALLLCVCIVLLTLAYAAPAQAFDAEYCMCVACGAVCQWSQIGGWFECYSTGNMQDPCYFCELGCSSGGVTCCYGFPIF